MLGDLDVEDHKEIELADKSDQTGALEIKVGPFFDGDKVNILDLYRSSRKPSREVLERVKLRPTYVSFPTPHSGRSPTGRLLNTPRIGYSSIVNSPPLYPTSPDSVSEYFGSLDKLTVVGTTLSAINYFIGIGMLGLPYGVKIAGWNGLITLTILGSVMCYSGLLLGKCQSKLSLLTYPDIAEAAYGYCGRDIVSAIFYFHLLFVITLYLELLTTSVQLLCQNYHYEVHADYILLSMALLLVCFTTTLTTMNTICWFSAFGTISTTLVAVLVVVDCSRHFANTHGVTNVDLIGFRDGNIWSQVLITAKCFGIYSYCYMGHAVLPSLHKNMMFPDRYPQVVTTTFVFMIMTYIVVSTIGFLAYGGETSGNIVENFRDDSSMATAIIALLIITVTSKFILASYPLAEGLVELLIANFVKKDVRKRSGSLGWHQVDYSSEESLYESFNQDSHTERETQFAKWSGLLIRMLIPFAALVMVLMVPNFLYLLSIIGATFGLMISLVVPILSYLRIYRDDVSLIEKILAYIIVVVGLTLGVLSLMETNVE